MFGEFILDERMSEVYRMKSLKTYNLDQDVINILKREKNKSLYVCRAVRRLAHITREFDIEEVALNDILNELSSRIELNSNEWKAFVVLNELLQADS